jgi:phytoene dehydrogenase-like protein
VRVAVVGAGIGCLTAALCMTAAGIDDVAVAEYGFPYPAPKPG